MRRKNPFLALIVCLATAFTMLMPVQAAQTKIYSLYGPKAKLTSTWLHYTCKPDAYYASWAHPNGKKIKTKYRTYKFRITKNTRYYLETGSDPFTIKRISKKQFYRNFKRGYKTLATYLECKNGNVRKITLLS
jgi:hypothetical protein